MTGKPRLKRLSPFAPPAEPRTWAVLAALVVAFWTSTALGDIPPVEDDGCDGWDVEAISEFVDFELSGLGLEVRKLELDCSGSDVRVIATVGEQALVRELDLAELEPDDAKRFIGLSLVEMVEILNRSDRPDINDDQPDEPIVADRLVVLAPASPPAARPTNYDWTLGVGAIVHYQFGYDAPFAGVGIETSVRAAQLAGVADLHLSFRTLDVASDQISALNVSTSLQAAWIAREWLALGPGARFGIVRTARDATDRTANAYWGGLFMRAQAQLPFSDHFYATFGLELGYSPWTYTVIAEDSEQVEMRGLFTNAYLGARWR